VILFYFDPFCNSERSFIPLLILEYLISLILWHNGINFFAGSKHGQICWIWTFGFHNHSFCLLHNLGSHHAFYRSWTLHTCLFFGSRICHHHSINSSNRWTLSHLYFHCMGDDQDKEQKIESLSHLELDYKTCIILLNSVSL